MSKITYGNGQELQPIPEELVREVVITHSYEARIEALEDELSKANKYIQRLIANLKRGAYIPTKESCNPERYKFVEQEIKIDSLEHELKKEQARLDWVFHEDNFMAMFLKNTENMHMGQIREAIDKEIEKEN